MDIIYQLIELHGLRPLQTVVIAVFLAFIPYLLVRGPATRVARYFIRRHAARHEPHPSHGA